MPHAHEKSITTSSVGGMAGMVYSQSTYGFDEKTNLVLIRQESQDWVSDKQYFLKTVKERKNGEMVVVSTEIMKR